MMVSKENTGIAIWLGIFALLIPIVLIFAIKNPTSSIPKIDVEITSFLSSGITLEEAESEEVKATLVQNNDSVSLIIQCKKTFESTSALVYELKNGKKGKLLGQLIKKEAYLFSASRSLQGIVLIDPIYKQDIVMLKF